MGIEREQQKIYVQKWVERERESTYLCTKRQKIDYLNKIDCRIDRLMWMILRSGYVKQKKQVLSVKQTENFSRTNANALRPSFENLLPNL